MYGPPGWDRDRLYFYNEDGGDDFKTLTKDHLKKLNRYQRFEKYFPFYKMNVAGFIYNVEGGRRYGLEDPENDDFADKDLKQVESYSSRGLDKQFSRHNSWVDLENESSELTQFLHKVCADDDDSSKLSIKKLRCLGILWCDGRPAQKVKELYENLQDAD